MRRQLRRLLLFPLALLFIFEAWLWDATGAAIKYLLGWFPYAQLKIWVAKRIEHFSPWLTLGVFIIPALILLPLKFMTVFLLAKGYVLPGICMAIIAKLMGLGVSSFLFALCKPKLMQLRFIRWLYEHLVYWRERARVLVAPYMAHVRALVATMRGWFPRGNLIGKLRSRVKEWRA